MSKSDDNWWALNVDLSGCEESVHYKYGIYDVSEGAFKSFEAGPDRIAAIVKAPKAVVLISDGFVKITNSVWKGAGVGLPVFSIRTKSSFGVGDFEDVKMLVDWAERVGLKLIQVLPLNDTIGTHTDEDVLPYQVS